MKRSSWTLLVLFGIIAMVTSGGCGYPGAALLGYIVPFYGWWGGWFCYLPYIVVAGVVLVFYLGLVHSRRCYRQGNLLVSEEKGQFFVN
jgi:hypothetical protein